MAQNEFFLPSVDDSARSSNLCAGCGQTAEIYFSFLREQPVHEGNFCLSCGEALIRDLLHQRAVHGQRNRPGVDPAHLSLLHTTAHPCDDADNGIVFWEGHGWSSDGPFAGA